MKKLLVLCGFLCFCYFAFTQIDKSRTFELSDKLEQSETQSQVLVDKVIALKEQNKTLEAQKQELRRIFLLAYPEQAEQIDEILGFNEEDKEAEKAEEVKEESSNG